jgi:eukaryotic-like serine/threonine-protein kinase
MTRQWFGDYEIVKRLRVGGMATLYLARRHGAAGFARLVALKMIHPHLAEQPAFVEMFVDEARICSQISHPNVVHVEEFGTIDQVHYLVMEYLDGCSIGELLVQQHREGRRIDPELAARIILQVAAGLHAAHEARDDEGQLLNVIHRDISPSNILLSSDGNAKLIDFGIAKARNRLSQTAVSTTLKGKYNYVAPEQAGRGVVDRRCDIFSLGIVFWELLVGQRLFPEDTYVALFNRLARTDVMPPSTLNPAVPAALDLVVLAMLRHDPANRPPTAAEVQRRIASAVPGAANREACEIGALVTAVRDRRAGAPPATDSRVCFSPTPRSIRAPSSDDQRDIDVDADVDVDVDVDAGVGTPSGTGVREPPPTRRPALRRWAGRRVQLGLAALLGVAATVGILLTAHGGRPQASARATGAKVEGGVPDGTGVPTGVPTGATTAIAPQTGATIAPLPSSAVASPPSSAPSPPLPTAHSPPSLDVSLPARTRDTPPPAELPTREVTEAAPAYPVRAPPGDPTPTPAPVAKRSSGRALPRLRPSRPAKNGPEAAPVPDAEHWLPSPDPPFRAVPFDDIGDDHAPPTKPRPASLKKAPTTPEIDRTESEP